LLHAGGERRIAVTEADGGSCGDTTSVLALANTTTTARGIVRQQQLSGAELAKGRHVASSSSSSAGGAMIFVSNSGRASCNVTLICHNLLPPKSSGGATTARLYRIDAKHGNPIGLWQTQVRACVTVVCDIYLSV
jgi:hypothetical protein